MKDHKMMVKDVELHFVTPNQNYCRLDYVKSVLNIKKPKWVIEKDVLKMNVLIYKDH